MLREIVVDDLVLGEARPQRASTSLELDMGNSNRLLKVHHTVYRDLLSSELWSRPLLLQSLSLSFIIATNRIYL